MQPQQDSGESAWEEIFRYAVQFHSNGRGDEAGSLFSAILEHHPGHLPSLQRLASIRRQQGRLEESLTLMERAVAAFPDSAESHNSLGNALNAAERTAEAVEHYRAAATLRAPFPEALLNLGNSLSLLKRFEEAVEAYRAAIAARPEFAEAHMGLGCALDRLNRPAEALGSFTAAVSFDPKIKLGFNNVAMALAELNRHEEAASYFEKARQLEPEQPELLFNEALLQLALGNFERGLQQYEARWQTVDFKNYGYEFAQPQWDGRADLAGKTILLHVEQGLGDAIFFSRYVELVVAKGARVLVATPSRLVPLMRSIPGVAQILSAGESMPDFDFHSPFGSLPLAFGTTVDTIPGRTPYLHPPASEGVSEQVRVRPRVGICWAGNPSNRNDRNRSVPLALFEALLGIPGMEFVSLQRDLRPGDESILDRYPNVDRSADRESRHLGDTAALIAQLDLVVSADTAVAHLAGALNRPVWILVGFRPYWVWLRGRTDSPWYPSARLFRQPEFGDWKRVMETVCSELQRWVQAKR